MILSVIFSRDIIDFVIHVRLSEHKIASCKRFHAVWLLF